MHNTPQDRLFVTLQRLLPARLLGRAVHALSRSRNRLLKDALIRGFVRLYDVDVAEAALPTPQGFASFNDFFTRALRPGARPPDPEPAAVVSPADGTIQQIGRIEDDQLLQVKGQTYGLAELFGGDTDALRTYRGGAFATIYLAPWNYHRVHMPLGGRVHAMNYVPGALWSVNAATASQVPGLFARNERLICHCKGPGGAFAVILVGAMNVGSISTVWAGEVLPRTPRRAQRWDYGGSDPRLDLPRSALLGQFNLGSTVIVVVPRGAVEWDPGMAAGMTVRVGRRLGRCLQL
jgi:phosphatidylserine decarboxylase